MMPEFEKDNCFIGFIDSETKNKTFEDMNASFSCEVMPKRFIMVGVLDDFINLSEEDFCKDRIFSDCFVNGFLAGRHKVRNIIHFNDSRNFIDASFPIGVSFSASSNSLINDSFIGSSSTGCQSIASQNSQSSSVISRVCINRSDISCFINFMTALVNNSESNFMELSDLSNISVMQELKEIDYKKLSVDDFALQQVTDVYEDINNGDEVYFLDSENNPVKVKSISKEDYSGKIYDVDVENDVVLVRRNNGVEGLVGDLLSSLDINPVMMVKIFKNKGISFYRKEKDETSNLDSFKITQIMSKILEMPDSNDVHFGNLSYLFLYSAEQRKIFLFEFSQDVVNFRTIYLHNESQNLLNSSTLIDLPDDFLEDFNFSTYSSFNSSSSTGYQSILSQNSWSSNDKFSVCLNFSNISCFINLITALDNNSKSNFMLSDFDNISSIKSDNEGAYLSFSIKEFSNLMQDRENEVYSKSVWSGNSDREDVFDLRILGGVEFDYIVDPSTPPNINFVDPTPTDNEVINISSSIINISITNETALDEVIYNWNGTNFTYYNDSLVLMMNFDNVSALGENDTHVVDLSNWGNNGTVVGGNTTIAGGKYNRGMQFDGVNDYVYAPTTIAFGRMSLSYWVKFDSLGSQAIISPCYASSCNFTSGSHRRGATKLLSTNKLFLLRSSYIDGCYWNATILYSNKDDFQAGEWYHIAETWDSQDENIARVYINGELDNSTPVIPSCRWDLYHHYLGRGSSSEGQLNGLIDEIKLYSRVLSATEVYQEYAGNLNKYDTDKWLLFVNQSLNATDGLADGDYTYQAFAKDDAGNLNETEERTLSVDVSTAPTVNLTSPFDNWYVNDSAVFECSISDTYQVKNLTLYHNNSGTWVVNQSSDVTGTGNSSSWIVSGLSANTFLWGCYGCDSNDNCAWTSSNRTVIVDLIKPNISFVSPTEADNANVGVNYTYVNVSVSDASNNVSAFIDWNNSLVGWWRMEQGNGSFFVDSSSYENHGTQTTASKQPSLTTGYRGKAYEFDGVNDYVNIPYTLPNEGSISLWYYARPWYTYQVIFDNSVNTDYWEMWIYNNGILSWRISVDSQLSYDLDILNGPNNWYHIVAVWNSSANTWLYVNGILRHSDLGANTWRNPGTNFYLGGGNAGNTKGNGTIDEVQIFNRALSPEEINASYQAGVYRLYNNFTDLADGDYVYTAYAVDQAGNLNETEERSLVVDTTIPQIDFVSPTLADDASTPNISVEVNVSINETALDEVIYNWNGTNFTYYNNSLVLMMNFDNVSALGENNTHVVDMSNWGNNGTVVGAVYNTTDGKYGWGMQFDGVNDYVSAASPGLNVETIAVWIKFGHTVTDYEGVVSFTTGTDRREILIYTDGSPGFDHMGGAGDPYIVSTEGDIDDGNWYHVVGTYDGTTRKLYVDGNEVSTASSGASAGISNTFYIGRLAHSGVYSFTGTLDEVRIWNISLSADEVYQEYAGNLNKYDTDKWLLYVNQSLNSTYGLTDGSYTYQAFAKDDAGNLNQTAQRTLIVDAVTAPTITLTSPFNNWYVNDSAVFECSITDTYQIKNLTLYHNNSGTWTANETESLTGTSNASVFNISGLSANTFLWGCYGCDSNDNCAWTSSNRTIKGDLTKPNINFVNQTDADDANVGRNYSFVNVSVSDASNNISAFIDWNNSLVGWWRLEQGNGSFFVDSSGTGNHGTQTTASKQPTLTTGYRGKAYEFDGVNDYVKIANDDEFDNPNGFTASLWINLNQHETGQYVLVDNRNLSPSRSWYIWIWHAVAGTDSISITLTNTSVGLTVSSGGPLDRERWYHVVAVYNGSYQMIYVDGVLKDADEFFGTLVNADRDLYIGSTGTSNYFNGTIDEVQIFNRALSPEEINASYQAGVYRLYNNFTDLADGDYTYKAYAVDMAGNLNETEQRTLIVDAVTAPTITLTSPFNNWYVNDSAVFECSITDTYQVKNLTLYHNNSGTWTVNQSSDVIGTSNSSRFIVSGLSANTFDWGCYGCDSNDNCAWTSSNRTVIVDLIQPMISFVNQTDADSASVNRNYSFVNVSVSDVSNNVSAFIDWNRSLVGWWRMENNYLDSSSWGNDGTAVGSPTLTTGYRGKAYSFDGVNDRVTSNGATSAVNNTSFTFLFWFMDKETSSTTYEGAFGFGYVDGQGGGHDWGLLTSSTPHYWRIDFRNTTTTSGDISPKMYVNDTNWNQYGVTFEVGTGNWVLYKNGQINSNGTSSVKAVGTKSDEIRIGGRASSFVKGSIDEVQIFNRALSPEEINASYQAGIHCYDNETEVLTRKEVSCEENKINLENNLNNVRNSDENLIDEKNKGATKNVASMVIPKVLAKLNINESNNYLSFSVNNDNVEEASVALKVMHQPHELGSSGHLAHDLARDNDNLTNVSTTKSLGVQVPGWGASTLDNSQNTDVKKCYEYEWKYFKDVTYEDKVATLNETSAEVEFHQPEEIQNYAYRGEMFNIETEKGNLVVSPEHKVYVKEENQILSNFLKSSVLNMSTFDCSLNLGSLDQIAHSNFNASANIGTSLSCINCLACDSNISNEVFGTTATNLDSSDKVSLNCDELSLEYFNTSDSLFFNSSIVYSGVDKLIPKNSALTIINLTGFSLKKDSNILVSTTNCILHQPSFLYLFQTPSLILSPSLRQSSSVNSEFSNNLSNFLSNCALLTFSDKNLLTDSDQFISGKESRLCFKSSGTDSVKFGILKSPQSLVYPVKDVQVFKSFAHKNLNGFKLIKISDIDLEDKQLIFLDENLEEIKVQKITKESYDDRIYDVTVPNHIILVRRGGLITWSGNSLYNNFTDLSDGDYTYKAYAVDMAGNLNETEERTVSVDNVNPVVTLISPTNNTGDIDGNVTFSYNVSDINGVASCSVIINDEINTTNTSITKNITQTIILNNLGAGAYNWGINCSDNASNVGAGEDMVLVVVPSTEFTMTDLSDVNISNVTNLEIENSDWGKITIAESIDLSDGADIDEYVNISYNRIEIDATSLPQLNKSATLRLYNLTYSNPRVLKDGAVCPASICTEVSYSGGTFVFTVTGFSVYSAGETPTATATTSSSSGGGGAGAGVVQRENFKIDENSFNVNIVVNDLKTREFKITNLKERAINISVANENLDGLILIQNSVELAPLEEQLIKFKLVSPNEFGIYTGKILLKFQGVEKEIFITLNVQSKDTLFDVSVAIPDKKIPNNEMLIAQFNLLPIGEKGIDVSLRYLIKDFKGETYLESSETFYVDSEKSFVKEFDISKLPVGDYVLGTEMIYIGGVAVASAQFEVTESNVLARSGFKFLIFTGVAVLIIIIIIFVLINRKIKIQKNLKKYKRVKINES